MSWLAILVAGCTAGGGTGTTSDDTTTTTDSTPTDSTPTDTEPTIDTAPIDSAGTGSTGDSGEPYECGALPAIPVTWTEIQAFETSEDFDIDGDGYLCSNVNNNLACKDMYGSTKIVSPNIGFQTAGIRILPDGNWLVNNVGAGSLVLVNTLTGGQTTVVSGIAYPNGLEVSRDGRYAFIGENGSDRVRQIEIATGAQYIAGSGMMAPNGVILAPDEQTLYVGSFGGGIIYAVDRISETEWDAPRTLYNPPNPDGGFDGINIDICGNVYITEYTVGRVYRLTDDGGLGNGEVVDLPEFWIPNMRWGHDINGWDSHTLYVTAWDSLYALDMGIQGKKHVMMP